MAITVLDELAADIDRLVLAGALAARGDDALLQHQQALEVLGARVPALAKTARIIETMRTAPLEAAGAALLQLDAAVQQLRAAQLAPRECAGELTELPVGAAAADDRAAPVRLLYALLDAMASRKKPPESLEAAFRDPALAADSRLWSSLVEALSHTYLRAQAALLVGAIGPAILPVLAAGFKKKGGAADGARLRAMAAILRTEGAALYRDCLRTGSKEVREAAFECCAEHLPALAEEVAIAAYEEAATDKGRMETVRELVLVGNGATLARVMAVGARFPTVAGSTIERLLRDASLDALLGVARVQLAATGETPSFASSPELIWALTRRHVMGGRSPAIDYLNELLRHPAPTVKVEAARALLAHSNHAVTLLADVGMKDTQLYEQGVAAAFAISESVAFAAIQPFFPAAGSAAEEIDPRFLLAVSKLSRQSDRRFFEPLVALLRPHLKLAMQGLESLGDPRTIPLMMDLASGSWGDEVRYAIHLLGKLRAKEAGLVMAKWLEDRTTHDWMHVITTALAEAGAVSAIPTLARLIADPTIGTNKRRYLEHTLQQLQAKERP